jgi:hypothetical protein
VRLAYDTPAQSDSLTRGGPLMGTPARWSSRLGVSSNDARRNVWSLDGSYSTDERDGWGYSARTRLLVRLRDRYTFSVAPGYERALDSRQYFATLEGGPAATFGERYVFAELDRSTIFTQLRAGMAMTPNVGLDVYVEPFAASGSYESFGELPAAGSDELRLYGTDGTSIAPQPDGSQVVTVDGQTFTLDNADFDLSSYRSNVVFHWDYAQGSTLYVVWAQNRVSGDFRG